MLLLRKGTEIERTFNGTTEQFARLVAQPVGHRRGRRRADRNLDARIPATRKAVWHHSLPGGSVRLHVDMGRWHYRCLPQIAFY